MADYKDPSHVDALIIGAGPAGLMAASWMSRLGVKTRIIDKRSHKVFSGQADGLQPRTMEIFDSLDIAHKVEHEALPFSDMANWTPDKNQNGRIVRQDRLGDVFLGMSRFHEYVLNQGYIERYLLEGINDYSDIGVERGVLPIALSIDEKKVEDPDAYPVTVQLRHLSEDDAIPSESRAHIKSDEVRNGLHRSNLTKDDTSDLIDVAVAKENYSETVHAKYVIGCDGAHSWTRQQLGLEMKGEATDYVWGVIDVMPISDFPDVRRPCTIQSEQGSMLIIPREKKLVRFYTQLLETEKDDQGEVDKSKINPEVILETARKILDPYSLDYTYCDWWTAYQVGQRVGTGFNDPGNRVFLAGDAVHTHSPKAGQGMNVSMQDTYNLCWKMGGVVKGWLRRDVLKTYEPERRKLAQDLIDFDHKLSRVFSGSPTEKELQNMYMQNMVFMSGCGIKYAPSILTASPTSTDTAESVDPLCDKFGKQLEQVPIQSRQEYAKNIGLGRVFASHLIYAHADTRPWEFQHFLRADGRWRLIVFAGDVSSKDRMQKITEMGERMVRPGGLVDKYTVTRPSNGTVGKMKQESLIDVLLVHCASIDAVDVTDFHKAYFPLDPEEGYHYDKIFTDIETDRPDSGKTYDSYGVDKEKGALVVTRPDQYVGFITSLDGLDEVEQYFEKILLEPKAENASHVNGHQ